MMKLVHFALICAPALLWACAAPPPSPAGPTMPTTESTAPHGFGAMRLEVAHPNEDAPRQVDYRLRRPAAAEPGRLYPLVVFLHGAGERGDDNERQLIHFGTRFDDAEVRARFDGFVLAPQCPEGERWVEASWSDLPPPAMDPEPSRPLRDAIALLEHTLRTEPIDPDRVVLTGLSMGGQGAWELAVRRPGTFAALAPLCGGADPAPVSALVDVPVWAWHGVDDAAVPFERTELMVEALRAAGGNVRFERLPEGTGHAAWNVAYAPESPLWAWFAAARR